MDDGCTSAPVELPDPHVEPQLGRRRHRRITGASGLLLFACMFLPAVKGCGEPVYPIEMPELLPPYLYGLVFALAAMTLTARGLRYAIVGLRVTAVITMTGSLVVMLLAPAIGFVELVGGVILLAAIGWTGHSERRAAMTAIAIGVLCTLWFGLWAASPDALVGVYLSTLAAVGMLVGGLVWLGEAGPIRHVPIAAPRPFVRSHE